VKAFLKRNFVMVLGVSLPLLLIAVLLLVQGISRMTAARPAFPVFFVSYETYFDQHFYAFDIGDDGRLDVAFSRPANDAGDTFNRPGDAILVLYDARSESLDTFRLKAPEDSVAGSRVELALPQAVSALAFSDQRIAPDGYRLELSGYRGGGLLRELFGGGRKSRDYRLVRDGVSFNVPDIAGSGFGQNAAFIGWVVDDYDGDRS